MLGYGKNASRSLCYAYTVSTGMGFNTSGNNVSFAIPFPSTRMTHVCLAISGRGVAFYVDGAFMETKNLSSAPSTTLDTGRIGHYPGGSDYYHGKIAACRIYSRALSEREILVLSHEFHPQEVSNA